MLNKLYRKYIKRILDVLFSVLSLPLFIVLLIFIAPVIKLEDGGSVFYKAKRRGSNGKVIEIYKFRSMFMNSPDLRNEDNSTYNSLNDPRVTNIGRILRKTSLDEIPQILNVIIGDMSIVGPRPITIDKPLEEYDEKRKIRLSVRPGITGFQQAYYRNSIDQERKFELDEEYVKRLSFIFDLKIIFKTITTVLSRKNVYTIND